MHNEKTTYGDGLRDISRKRKDGKESLGMMIKAQFSLGFRMTLAYRHNKMLEKVNSHFLMLCKSSMYLLYEPVVPVQFQAAPKFSAPLLYQLG